MLNVTLDELLLLGDVDGEKVRERLELVGVLVGSFVMVLEGVGDTTG